MSTWAKCNSCASRRSSLRRASRDAVAGVICYQASVMSHTDWYLSAAEISIVLTKAPCVSHSLHVAVATLDTQTDASMYPACT